MDPKVDPLEMSYLIPSNVDGSDGETTRSQYRWTDSEKLIYETQAFISK